MVHLVRSYYLRLCGALPAVVVLCFAATSARAQIEVTSGIEMSYPLLLNKYNSVPNYGQITFGLKAGVAYKPDDVQFFPVLNLSFGRTRLALTEFGNGNVATLSFNYLNAMINENYVVRLTNGELYVYGGIGCSYLMEKGLDLSGPRAGTMKSSVDSTANISKAFPAMNLGFEYVWGESTGKDLYLSMGINFQYILLLQGRNSYYISIYDPQNGFSEHNADLAGNVISPGFYLSLHYIFRGK